MEDVSLDQVKGLSESDAKLFRIRHSLAHVLAQAVLDMRPGTRLAFGPPVETGFYYDFDLDQPLTEADLPRLEAKMREIIKAKQAFAREDLPVAEAEARLASMGQAFKVEHAHLLGERGLASISFYKNGPFVDMCEGPHVRDTGEIPSGAFKLDTLAGAYWRGNEKNKMLTRVYGLAFLTEADLASYIERRKLAVERDHRKLGKELDLYEIDDSVGRGLPLWLPKGTVIREEIERFAKEIEFRYGYARVATPHITKEELFYRSGHLPYFKEDMYPPLEIDEEGHKERYYLKPMNCPFHHRVYSARPKSYRDLPLRLAEYGTVYRYERSGQLSGLSRARMLSMNDAHIYLREDQIEDEITALLKMYGECYQTFELPGEYSVRLSLHAPDKKEKYFDDPAMWEKAEAILARALTSHGIAFNRAVGEAAFYGPKIDFQFRTLQGLGKDETMSTIQLDFLAAKKFDLHYIGSDGAEHPCVVIHRAPMSTHERFVSYLIEKWGGAFPLWLAPVQVRVIPIADEVLPFAREVAADLHAQMIRVEVDDSAGTLGKKIRAGTTEKIPVLAVIGAKEQAAGAVNVRRYGSRDQTTVPRAAFVDAITTEARARGLRKS
jgi:threonyl-tRNA synthetase